MMMSLPLHPVMVHLPLAIALLMPLFALAAVWAIWTRRMGRRAWAGIAALQLLLVLTSFVAIKTGEREEGRVEAVVPGAALHLHEEYAEQFAWGGAAVLASALVAFVPAATRVFALVSLIGMLAVAGLAVRVGHAGGQLVYVHNAGAAYQAAGRTAAADPGQPGQGSRRRGGVRPNERDEDDANH